MAFRIALLAAAALAAAVQAQAASVGSVSVFATSPAGSKSPDSITVGNGSVWAEYGNGVDSTGVVPGKSTIVQYNAATGAVQRTLSISGSVDGLKIDPTTGAVWALQNQDGNATLSLINPISGAVTGPLKYATPPYAYGVNPDGSAAIGQGYDDTASIGAKVFLSRTNPATPTDPVIERLNQGHTPTGTLTTTPIVTAGALDAAGKPIVMNDPDSLKATPDGKLVQTSAADGNFLVISNPGTATQSIVQTQIQGVPAGNAGLDDVLFPDATRGTLYYAATGSNQIFSAFVTGLSLTDPLVALASARAIVEVAPDGSTRTLIGGVAGPHGIGFVADLPEPAALAALVPGLAFLASLRRRRR